MEKLIIVEKIVIDTKIGNQYQVILTNPSGKNSSHLKYRPFEGVLIQETLDHLTLRSNNGGYCESFLKKDFAIKYYVIKEKINGRWSQLQVKY